MSTKPRTIRKAIAGIVATARPELAYSYPRTFLVRSCDPATGACDVYPPPGADDLPRDGIVAVPQWSLGGALYFPPAGSSCIVVFRDALETRPVIVAFEPATVGQPSARKGDLVVRLYNCDTAGPAFGLNVSESVTAPFGWSLVASGPAPTIADSGTPVTIAQGSSLVKVAP